jgi:hypothetical protein
MATNIIEALQMNLGYGQLEKVDPNSQQVTDRESNEKLGQAAIPAVLTALYKLTRTEEGARQLLNDKPQGEWGNIIYKGKSGEAVEKVAQYAGVPVTQASTHMDKIAEHAVKLIREAAGKQPTPQKIQTYMNSQRHNILVYLPAALNMGDVLNDETLDDKTNKMEGPVSNVMHKIENTFSSADKKEGNF